MHCLLEYFQPLCSELIWSLTEMLVGILQNFPIFWCYQLEAMDKLRFLLSKVRGDWVAIECTVLCMLLPLCVYFIDSNFVCPCDTFSLSLSRLQHCCLYWVMLSFLSCLGMLLVVVFCSGELAYHRPPQTFTTEVGFYGLIRPRLSRSTLIANVERALKMKGAGLSLQHTPQWMSNMQVAHSMLLLSITIS